MLARSLGQSFGTYIDGDGRDSGTKGVTRLALGDSPVCRLSNIHEGFIILSTSYILLILMPSRGYIVRMRHTWNPSIVSLPGLPHRGRSHVFFHDLSVLVERRALSSRRLLWQLLPPPAAGVRSRDVT